MTIEVPSTHTEAVDAFLASADWLTVEDLPAVTALKTIAMELDTGPFQAAIMSQYGLHYRALLKRRPPDAPQGDELEDLFGAEGTP